MKKKRKRGLELCAAKRHGRRLHRVSAKTSEVDRMQGKATLKKGDFPWSGASRA
jgi:hypothetical protein